jgi:glycosyltransferase 2 family protein
MAFVRRHAIKFILSAIITACLLYMLHREKFSLVPPLSAFSQVKLWVIPLYIASYSVTSYYRAMRWRFLLRPFATINTKRLLSVSFVGFAAILLLPFRIGEFVRPMMIREKGRISLSSATGTVVGERVVDGLVLSLVLAAALLWVPTIEPLPTHVVGLPSVSMTTVRGSGMLILSIFTSAFVVIAVFYFARQWARLLTLKVIGLVSKRLAEKLADMAEKLAGGLRFLSRKEDALPFLGQTIAYWTTNAAGMWLLAWGCGVQHADGSAPTLLESFAIMGMLGATILIPGPPGLLGVFHVGITCGMSLYYPASNIATAGAAYSFSLYASQLVWTIVSGAWGLSATGTQALTDDAAVDSIAPPPVG